MNIEELREYCLSKKGAEECFPFDEVTLVFKVMNKMFALVPLDADLQINLKCSPEKSIELREKYPCVIPGYHMSKKHWNTIIIDGSISDKLIREWIDHSYDEVMKGLTKKFRDELKNS
ncbi:MAG: MmcQ/YjbR family DNA-binding protein [Bacteroidales bacterium]|nr:MmcQ/YjbR family DNA-binding protein [Bacteroidales bacterium]